MSFGLTVLSLLAGLVTWWSIESTPKSTNPVSQEMGAPFIRHFSPKEYNAHVQNWEMLQDGRGLMYFANNLGVLEYDGVSWRLITLPNNSLARRLALDSEGTLYVGGIGDFGYLAYNQTGKTVFVSLSDRIESAKEKNYYMISIHATSHGVYFITQNAIYRWHRQKLEIVRTEHETYVTGAAYDLILISYPGGLAYIRDGRVYPLPGVEGIKSLLSGWVAAIRYGDGRVLLLTKEEHYLYDTKVLQSGRDVPDDIPIEPFAFAPDVDDYLRRNRNYKTVPISGGRFATATLQGGIIVTDIQGRLVRVINKARGLSEDLIWSLFEDRDKNLWAVSNNGIFHIQLSSPISVFNSQGGVNSMPLHLIRHRGSLFAATFMGVSYLSPSTLKPENNRFGFLDIPGFKGETFVQFVIEGEHYVIGNQVGLYRIGSNGAVEIEKSARLGDKTIIRFCQSKRFPRHVFLYAQEGQFFVLHISEGKLEFIKEGGFQKFDNIMIQTMLADDAGDVWLGQQDGKIVQLKFRSSDVMDFDLVRYGSQHGLPDGIEPYLYYLDGDLFVGTIKDIYRAEKVHGAGGLREVAGFVADKTLGARVKTLPPGKKFTQLFAHNDRYIVSNMEDELVLLEKRSDHVYHLNQNALKKIEGQVSYALAEQAGPVWIGTNEGVYRYDPRIEKNYRTDFGVLIRRVEFGEKKVVFEGAYFDPASKQTDVYLKTSRIQDKELVKRVAHGDNSIILEYAATFYEHSAANRYKIMLEGFDRNWSDWNEITRKEYTNLPEGDYRFRVRAKNIFGYEGKSTDYRFVVLPPWYRTTYAYVGMFLVFCLLFYLGVRAYTWRLVAAKKKLEGIVNARTRDLKESLDMLKKTQKQLVDASWKAGMAEVATGILHNVGNVLNSVNVSSKLIRDRLRESKLGKLGRAIEMGNDFIIKPAQSVEDEQKREKLTTYLSALNEQLNREREFNLDDIENLDKNIEHINTIVASQQKVAVNPGLVENTTVKEVVEEAVELSNLQLARSDITLRMNVADLPPVFLSRQKVIQILVNLLSNAKHALEQSQKESRELIVEVDLSDEATLRFAVVDNGVGIKAEDMGRLFRYGFSTKKEGHGFGLHTSANGAKEMGGSLNCYSEGPGKGAAFYLDLPFNTQIQKA